MTAGITSKKSLGAARALTDFFSISGTRERVRSVDNWELDIPPPARGSIGGLPAAVLSAKNADAKRRLCAGAERQAVGWGSLDARESLRPTPTRLALLADLPLAGGRYNRVRRADVR